MKLSVVIPTMNRIDRLKRCVESIREFAPTVEHEIIVIDGNSSDSTRKWLYFQDDLVVLKHNYRSGCVKAFNDGFCISRGEYCAQLSDDVELRDDCLDAACRMLDRDELLGQVVIHHMQGGKVQHPQFVTDEGKFLFAAFGVTRRTLGDTVGWWGDYKHQQGDAELGLKIMNAGFNVELLPGHYVYHFPGKSEGRSNTKDGELFRSRWGQWKPS